MTTLAQSTQRKPPSHPIAASCANVPFEGIGIARNKASKHGGPGDIRCQPVHRRTLRVKIAQPQPGHLVQLDTTDTDFGFGAGAQPEFGSFAIRADYERFSSDGRDLSLLSIGASKSVL